MTQVSGLFSSDVRLSYEDLLRKRDQFIDYLTERLGDRESALNAFIVDRRRDIRKEKLVALKEQVLALREEVRSLREDIARRQTVKHSNRKIEAERSIVFESQATQDEDSGYEDPAKLGIAFL